MSSRFKNYKRGFTLVEMVVSILILGIVAGAMIGTFMISKVSVVKAKYYIEVMNLLRGEIENLKNTPYVDIQSVAAQDITIEDNLVGQILVEVKDKDDFDGDGDTTEGAIDVDGDGTNDSCKPIYVTISWTSYTWGGGDSNVSEGLVTLISE